MVNGFVDSFDQLMAKRNHRAHYKSIESSSIENTHIGTQLRLNMFNTVSVVISHRRF